MMRANVASWIALVLAAVGLACYRQGPWGPMRVSGALICVAAMVMMSVARYQLGVSFAVRARAQELVDTGIYGLVRNPIYIAGEMFFVGLALFLPSWIPIIIVVVTTPVQVWRARREGSVLREAFGAEYDAYRARTWC